MNHPPQFPGLSPIPPLGLGTWQWGDRWVWGFGKDFQASDAQQAYGAALEGGIRLIDTAEVYGMGMSERLIGQYYKESPTKPLIVSKMFPLPWRLSRKFMLHALRSSLKRLDMPHLDLYLLHWPWPPVPVEQWAQSLAEAYQMGLAKAVGVSNHDAEQMERVMKVLAKHKVPLAANQLEYNLLHRKAETSGLLKTMQTEGVVLMAYSPLGMGWLTGKYSLENPPPGRYRGQHYAANQGRIPGVLDALKQIAGVHGATPAQVALRWCIQKGTLPIPGAKNTRQAEGNAGALRLVLSEQEMARLDEA